MDLLLEALDTASAPDRDSHRPMFFRLTAPADRARLEELLKREPHTVVHDELHSQLRELVRTLNPSVRYTTEELDQAAVAHLKGQDPRAYGVWVHYPWSARLVHLLDEHEFVRVRTDRNRNKITADEQALLATKRIGVIGLSVGQSICLTLALERSFGELRIADFDTLELSNLNRIRSGTHAMGHLKTVNVAREIAEIDPFLNVTLFNEGVTRENIERFCLQGGKLDMLVDECDGVDVKILCRQKAKELRIPVLMDTSDRGMLDVERFDLEPDRPILHGLIDHLDPNDAAKARTNEEKLPFVLPIAGISTLSTRMKASMLEIESSVTTWPQLASSVILGGGATADVWRRIALDQFHESGRWFLDPEALLSDKPTTGAKEPGSSLQVPSGPSNGELVELADAATNSLTGSMSLDEVTAIALVQAGVLAPSGGNNQPWRFLLRNGRLFLFHDRSRSWSTIDPGSRYAYLGLGACLENMELQARSMGFVITTKLDGLSDPLVAIVERSDRAFVGPEPLADMITARCTNRKLPGPQALPNGSLRQIADSITGLGDTVRVDFITGTENVKELGRVCGEAERIRFLNTSCHRDMFEREMRFTPEQAVATNDGVDVRTLELKPSEEIAISLAGDPSTMDLLREWKAGNGFTKMTSRLVERSAAVAVLSIADLDLRNALLCGRALQRIWLTATHLGIAAQPVSAPIFMGIHRLWDRSNILSTQEHDAAKTLFDRVASMIGSTGSTPFFLLRLAIADEVTVRSTRRSIDEVLMIQNTATLSWKD